VFSEKTQDHLRGRERGDSTDGDAVRVRGDGRGPRVHLSLGPRLAAGLGSVSRVEHSSGLGGVEPAAGSRYRKKGGCSSKRAKKRNTFAELQIPTVSDNGATRNRMASYNRQILVHSDLQSYSLSSEKEFAAEYFCPQVGSRPTAAIRLAISRAIEGATFDHLVLKPGIETEWEISFGRSMIDRKNRKTEWNFPFGFDYSPFKLRVPCRQGQTTNGNLENQIFEDSIGRLALTSRNS